MKTVILHGLGQTPQSWGEVVQQVAATDIDCPELFSLSRTEITYSRILAGLEKRYADTAKPFRMCGLSLGALLALDYAIRHRDQVVSLVLIGGRYKAPRLLMDVQNLLFRCMPRGVFLATGLSKGSMLQLTRSMRELDLTGSLGQIACPVTVVCGEKDRANQMASKKLAALLPQAELCIIPGAGHEVNRDAPTAIAEMLNR